MRYLAVFFLLLMGYTFIYTGVSKFWNGVTMLPVTGAVPSGS